MIGRDLIMVYFYVGPIHVLDRVRDAPPGRPMSTPYDLLHWMEGRRRSIATFVICEDGVLRLADRRTEHVACAGGEPVLAAGEITLESPREGQVYVVEATNQSTGYCPEPECWDALARALESIGTRHPERFTTEFTFRRCPACGQINIVKEDLSCGVCGTQLPEHWNFGNR